MTETEPPEPAAGNASAAWDQIRLSRMTIPDHVVHRALAHETVLLNVKSSTYHSIDEIGARFLQCLEAAPTVAAARDELAAEYEQPAERVAADLTAFVRQLLDHGLIQLGPGGPPTSAA